MQNLLKVCKSRYRRWRIQREANRIHRQALQKARTGYDAIPLHDPESYRRLVELNRVGEGRS
ncbi:hypothetical protein [uncultured Marinobacter sp.]|uniref:hypothetical protein n=1 Tax=uncultured Marinobacter sp. TaxID=187379 RepID=UPI002584AEB8|nr:hypothetical protein [uncultured Marinobacter sp.]